MEAIPSEAPGPRLFNTRGNEGKGVSKHSADALPRPRTRYTADKYAGDRRTENRNREKSDKWLQICPLD